MADDGCEVIPTIILLAASPVLRSLVSDAIFFSPMALSITGVSRDVLMCVRQILCTGEANVKSNIGDEVKMAMTMLGIESSLNCYQMENCGQGNVNDDQEKTDDEVEEVKSKLKEVKLDIYVKLGVYVERESGNNVGREFEDDVTPECESTHERGEIKDERSSDGIKHFDLMEADKNDNSVSNDEDHENYNDHGEKYTNLRKRKRVSRFGMKEDEVKVDSRSTKSLNHDWRQTKRRDPRTIIPDDYSPDVYAYDDSSLKCDGCEACPIRSERYKCTICEDYDLCSSCKEEGTHAETEHKMRKVLMYKCTGCEFKSPKKGLCKICKKWKFKI